jgi:uncharacterized protein YuzE
MKVWFDEEGDFLEVTFADRKGSFREIGPDLYERVDARGNVIGVAIFNFLKRYRKSVEIPLKVTQLAAARSASGSLGRRIEAVTSDQCPVTSRTARQGPRVCTSRDHVM